MCGDRAGGLALGSASSETDNGNNAMCDLILQNPLPRGNLPQSLLRGGKKERKGEGEKGDKSTRSLDGERLRVAHRVK